jgi:hypothetical protein
MTQIEFGSQERLYEYGVDRGVLYISDEGVLWPGLGSVEEQVVGGETSQLYYDGVKTLDLVAGEDFSLNVASYIYPDALDDGGIFGFSYRSKNGDGYKIHLVYNVVAVPGSKSWATSSGGTDLSDFSWTILTTPTDIPGVKPGAHLVVDSNTAPSEALEELENRLYGGDEFDARLPLPTEIVNLFLDHPVLIITDNGDGSWTATGPDEAIRMIDSESFEISWPSAIYITDEWYKISSM